MNEVVKSKLLSFSKKIKTDEPKIIGGYVRDFYLKKERLAKDIDITTNSADALRLAVGFAASEGLTYKIFNDLHCTVFTKDGINVDFSSNFISKAAINWAKDSLQISPDLYETVSRDFTINSMQQELTNNIIIDNFGGTKDCDNKVIKCITTPEICFTDDPRRAYRAILMSAKFNFKISDDIIDYVRANNYLFSHYTSTDLLSDNYIISQISNAANFSAEITIENLINLGLLKTIPLIGSYKEFIMQNNLLDYYLK